MKSIWLIVYNLLFLPLFWFCAKVFSLFNVKFKVAFRGRRHLFRHLRSKVSTFDPTRKNILIHCSSHGEFEQAKPIIDELDKSNKYNFIISFFSPSGFNHSKLDSTLNSRIVKTYLPFDSKLRINTFIDIINPAAVVFVKYDLWLNFLNELSMRNITRFLINGSINPKNLKWRFFISRSYKKLVYNLFSYIFVTDEKNKENFEKFLSPYVKIDIAGDTKYERIAKARELSNSQEIINRDILTKKNVFVVGSSWDTDENIILPVLDDVNSNGIVEETPLLSILVPHEPTENNLQDIELEAKEKYTNLSIIRFSDLNKYKDENTILVDRVGILMTLYKYADFAYVGGGFKYGLHNVLEPAGYKIPVLFGNEKLSLDAQNLVARGGGIAIADQAAFFSNLLQLLNDNDMRKSVGEKSYSVFEGQSSASKRIAESINKML